MDLRDQFAIAAMQAALGQIAELGPEPMRLVAAEAYEMADAMIAEQKTMLKLKIKLNRCWLRRSKKTTLGLTQQFFCRLEIWFFSFLLGCNIRS